MRTGHPRRKIGILDARGDGSSGQYRSRYVIESLGNPHAYPPFWRQARLVGKRNAAAPNGHSGTAMPTSWGVAQGCR